MASSLFPIFSTVSGQNGTQNLPLARDCDVDDFGALRFRSGRPVEVTGTRAVEVWAMRALQTARLRYEMHSVGYGAEIGRFIGSSLSTATQRAEVTRAIVDCLMASPYITAVTVENLTLTGNVASANIILKTVYGGGKIDI